MVVALGQQYNVREKHTVILYTMQGQRTKTKHEQCSTFSLSIEMSRLTRDGTAEPVSRDQILRHERGQGNIHFPCSADHVKDWQPYPVDPYSCFMCDHTYIHTGTR